MRLKSIKLAGFKSFAEPTRLDFPSNITCIVGPNGCGKSNTLDAIRWVMGESAARALRGGEMNDVLFNGTANRKSVSQCSVELLFDNADHRLKGAWNRYAEISVRRVHHREQGTQYYLNGQRCRRRDITALFDGTGLGPRSYALIGQGNISHIIESRPEQLRLFLEEAAGVGYYRQRRKETLSRLEAAQENLAQLQIQHHTWQEQAQQLKQQCEAAQRYRTLSDEIEQLTRWRYQLNHIALTEKISRLSDTLQQLQQAHGAQLLQVEQLQKEVMLSEKRLPELRQTVGQLQKEVHRLDKTIALREAEETRRQQEAATLEAQLAEQTHQLEEVERQKALLSAQRDGAELAQLPVLEQRLQQLRERAARMEAELEPLRRELEAARQQKMALQQQHHEAQRAFERAQQQLEQLSLQEKRLAQLLEEDHQALESLAVDALEKQLQAHQARQHELDEASRAVQAQLQALHARLSQVRESRQTLQRQLDELKSQKARAQAELSGLKAAQRQIVMARSETPVLARIHIHDPLWQPAIEAWLGTWLQGEVRERWPEVLEENMPFIGIETPQPQQPKPPHDDWIPLTGLMNAPGCILQAAQFVWCSKASPTPEQLSVLPPEQAVLTPDGRLWHPFGVEKLQTELAGVLERQRRIQSLEETLERIETELEALTEQLEGEKRVLERLNGETADSAQEAERLEAQMREAGLAIQQLKQKIQLRQHEKERLQQRLERNRAEVKALDEARLELERKLSDLKTRAETTSSQLDQQDAILETLHKQVSDREASFGQIRNEINDLSDKVNGLSREEMAYRQQLATLEARAMQLVESRQHLQQRLAMLQAQPDREETPLDELRARLSRLRDALRQQRETLNQVERTLGERRRQLQAEEKRAYELQEELSTCQLSLEQTQHALQNWVKEAEEHGLSPAFLRQKPLDAPDLKTVELRLRQAQRERDALGPVNMTAIEAWQALQEQIQQLEEQMADIQAAVDTLQQSIRKIDRDSRRRLRETFEAVNAHFTRLFPVIFRGGQAHLQWSDPDADPLENGVLVMAQPPGKRTTRIQMLSGGEKTLTALALIFALFELNPAPFCVLDEVDAPLDDANVMRFCELVKSMAKRVQFIIITHNKTTMTMADQLLGVTMHEPGVSRVVSVDIKAAVDMIEETA